MKYNIAVIGATGNVGREILNILTKSQIINIKEIHAIASEKSIGKEVSFGNKKLKTKPLSGFDFKYIDFAFFATNVDVSKEYIQKVSTKVKLVVDLSSHFRMNKEVPLIVPEVNLDSLKLATKTKIVANPNCVAIPLVVTLKNLHDFANVQRIVISTYQSVSGAGKKAMDGLYSQTKNKLVNAFSESNQREKIAFNLIPKIDDITENGYSKEEIKVINETKKILSNDIDVTATCVRVPVFVGHSISANVEFSKNLSVSQAYSLLNKSKGVITNKTSKYDFFTPIDCMGKNEVLVSRIRQDTTNNILNLWIVSDNLKKGAALNAVQIAEKYIENYI
ncbi:aspartate-semialdehyde dehydrogenase [Rickettsiales endosymbiont of Trichoplax sp. H2]|uniref:aspartate-semialdehyde dehydrogenase n=1 Tax=Rickettsiales endosymbiont of Trichoplax sp. H2 TaxID=2021221 RepID=UPI0012B2911A|nr:aspartate-semialdehyde dehydrogenase [Rickettsiales endosymbiont of Trichoplax sp. H2]MSO13828.1 Aspartate-semialdehyde dehydrogenase [Rickettsiales endosymbiont of Trichoplax sp. H2]